MYFKFWICSQKLDIARIVERKFSVSATKDSARHAHVKIATLKVYVPLRRMEVGECAMRMDMLRRGAAMVYKFIAFGAGQASSCLPFIIKNFDSIIFADTGQESIFTYAWVQLFAEIFSDKFIRVQTNMPTDIQHHAPICTKKFKVEPINRVLRSLGVTEAIKYLGFTAEEKHRIQPPYAKWITCEYPLIELGYTRKKCQQLLLEIFGMIPPRSGCIICKNNHRHEDYLKLKSFKVLNTYLQEGR